MRKVVQAYANGLSRPGKYKLNVLPTIRVGTVLECEVVPKMKKLLKFKIADGLENRTIVSGIAQHYKPEELVGKQVLFIANLAPRQFKNGLVSEGMILSAENFDGTLAVTSLLREVKPGSEVK
jgi:methionyl-tRNA synthetase